jgi:hypothetical protein
MDMDLEIKNISKEEKQILSEMNQRKKEFYNAGFNGEVLAMLPNLTTDTTEQERLQMINNLIDKICAEREYIPELGLKKAMQLLIKIWIFSYHDGLSARSSSKES